MCEPANRFGDSNTRATLAIFFKLQNDIAREVSERLRAQFSEADRRKMTVGSTTNPDAYRLYLKGSYYTAKFTKDGFDYGIHYLNRALALDPNYGQANSQLAYNYINQDYWYIDPKIAGPPAREAATKALSRSMGRTSKHTSRWPSKSNGTSGAILLLSETSSAPLNSTRRTATPVGIPRVSYLQCCAMKRYGTSPAAAEDLSDVYRFQRKSGVRDGPWFCLLELAPFARLNWPHPRWLFSVILIPLVVAVGV
jgi:hypothetical protein